MKLLKETYPVLRDFATKVKPAENVAASAMRVRKSMFPASWSAEPPAKKCRLVPAATAIQPQ